MSCSVMKMQVMYKNDVFAATFRLLTPAEPGRVALGALRLQCHRIEGDVSHGETTHGKPASVAGTVGRFVLQHQLPQVAVCTGLLSASLSMPAHAEVGTEFEFGMTVAADKSTEQHTSLKATVGTTGAVQLMGERVQAVKVEPGSTCKVAWRAVGKENGFVDVLASLEPDDELEGAVNVRAPSVASAAETDSGSLATSPAKGSRPSVDFALEVTGGMLLTKAAAKAQSE